MHTIVLYAEISYGSIVLYAVGCAKGLRREAVSPDTTVYIPTCPSIRQSNSYTTVVEMKQQNCIYELKTSSSLLFSLGNPLSFSFFVLLFIIVSQLSYIRIPLLVVHHGKKKIVFDGDVYLQLD